jgi:hypothetical protein
MRNNKNTIHFQKPRNPNGNHNQPLKISLVNSTHMARGSGVNLLVSCGKYIRQEKNHVQSNKTYQDEYYTHVNIASTIDMGRKLNLSRYENMVKIERGKRKRLKCLVPSASSIQRTMKCAKEIMTETVPWELVSSSNCI